MLGPVVPCFYMGPKFVKFDTARKASASVTPENVAINSAAYALQGALDAAALVRLLRAARRSGAEPLP